MNSNLVADAWADIYIIDGIYGIHKFFIALP